MDVLAFHSYPIALIRDEENYVIQPHRQERPRRNININHLDRNTRFREWLRRDQV